MNNEVERRGTFKDLLIFISMCVKGMCTPTKLLVVPGEVKPSTTIAEGLGSTCPLVSSRASPINAVSYTARLF